MKKSILTLTGLIVFIIIAISSCGYSTANLSDIKVGDQLKDGQVKKEKKVLSTDTPKIFVSAKLNNAPKDTELTFTWRYVEDEPVDIDSVEVVSQETQNVVSSALPKPVGGWPTGRYEVVLELDTDNAKPKSKKFEIR